MYIAIRKPKQLSDFMPFIVLKLKKKRYILNCFMLQFLFITWVAVTSNNKTVKVFEETNYTRKKIVINK